MFEELFTAFEEEGEELFYIGGYVRDLLLHRMKADLIENPLEKLAFESSFAPKDIDLATSAVPDKTIEILEKNGMLVVPLGVEFGTVRTMFKDEWVDITTYRSKESYTKGSRKPAVVFGKSIEEDLSRRDFTFNAIAMDIKGNLIDPFGGRDDLVQKKIRTPINPRESFIDDPLRMLRAARFEARRIGFIDWETELAMTELAHKIKEVSPERIFMEISSILMSDSPARGLEALVDAGIMKHIFPELQTVVDFKQNQGKHHSKIVWPHTLQVVQESPKTLEVRWAALFHDVAKPQTYSEDESGVHFYRHEEEGAFIWEQVADRLRVGGPFKVHVGKLIYYHLRPSLLSAAPSVGVKSLRRLAFDLGDLLDDLFDLSLADITSHREENVAFRRERTVKLKERIDKMLEEDDVPKLRLPKGTGLLVAEALGVEPGPALGEVMGKLHQMLIDGDLKDTSKGAIIAAAKEIVNVDNRR
jgi:putative nucleotidyltransferase with HDIG domain